MGRSRYALMTNEQGVVIDDGVRARFADEHFYVTATTSGVDRIYQQMLPWRNLGAILRLTRLAKSVSTAR